MNMERNSYLSFLKNILTFSIIAGVILVVLGGITYSDHWLAGMTFLICGVSHVVIKCIVPIRLKLSGTLLAKAEIYVQHNWLMIAIGLCGTCTYFAPFIAMESLAITVIGMIVAILTIITGAFGMYKSVKMTGVGIVV